MKRRNISLPDDLDHRARQAGLNVSALARRAIVAELDRQARMSALDTWLDELDEQYGPPSARAMADGTRWAEAAVSLGGEAERASSPSPSGTSSRARKSGRTRAATRSRPRRAAS